MRNLTASAALVGLLVAGCNSVTPGEEVLRDCLEGHGIDVSRLDPTVDGRGRIIVVSRVPDVDPQSGVVEECIAKANEPFE